MLPDKLTLFFDGSCTFPGGTAGFGWILVDENHEEVVSDSGEICSGEGATNNVGEWGAVLNGLRYLQKQKWNGELEIRGDSQLVIYQLSGKYKCRKDTLIPFYEECLRILKPMNWSANWIPREENTLCDDLSKGIRHDGLRVNPENPRDGAVGGSGSRDKRRGEVTGGVSQPTLWGEETPEFTFGTDG